MVISFVVAVYFQFAHEGLGFAPMHPSVALLSGVAITTTGWLLVTLFTQPASRETLQSFYDKIRPFPGGWRAAVSVDAYDREDSLPAAFLSWFLGIAVVYSALFGTGFLLYGRTMPGLVCVVVVVVAAAGLLRVVPRVGVR